MVICTVSYLSLYTAVYLYISITFGKKPDPPSLAAAREVRGAAARKPRNTRLRLQHGDVRCAMYRFYLLLSFMWSIYLS